MSLKGYPSSKWSSLSLWEDKTLSCAGIKPAGLHQASCATQKELLALVNGELLLLSSPKVTDMEVSVCSCTMHIHPN